jgi:hypothetical protein
VDVKRHAIGLPDGERRQDSLFSIHMAAVQIKN